MCYNIHMNNIEQHLRQRHVDLNLHRVFIDEINGVATFPLFNLSGQMVGFQQYRPGASKERKNDPRAGRYFTHRSSHTLAVFGVESLYLNPNILFVTEGIFDAVRLTEVGAPAIAVLSNNPTADLANFLLCTNRKIIAVCDFDAAGKKLAAFGDVAVIMDSKDLGDASQETVDNLVKKFMFC
ncbi:Archaeal primase DnaG/twinkle, TOPRIM domain [uncultured Caudovirales phage]|uniref:Archaeal primase DnaG/twinkle, TOPRIM domain n=1 Tax=uncultured Caudovirales phage TaxID=2100421 RepID=A0A6J5LAU8_9CAUD|nr:Archaeal primase DnaG/twinkle, TOPRIM domain [uncultured Caudovirales phage]